MDPKEQEFQELYRRSLEELCRFFQKRGFDAEEARDMAQQTFVQAFKNLDGFQYKSTMKTWLFSIARNLWKNEVRNRQCQKRKGEEVSLDEAAQVQGDGTGNPYQAAADDPQQNLIVSESMARLSGALQSLPPNLCHCVKLALIQGYSHAEVAKILKINSVGTVKSRLSEARKRLRQLLGDCFDF